MSTKRQKYQCTNVFLSFLQTVGKFVISRAFGVASRPVFPPSLERFGSQHSLLPIDVSGFSHYRIPLNLRVQIQGNLDCLPAWCTKNGKIEIRVKRRQVNTILTGCSCFNNELVELYSNRLIEKALSQLKEVCYS
jgi:hypothetical protein